MQVRNLAARLITLNWKGVKYPFMPAGPAVEVPDDAKGSGFLQALEKDRSVEISKSSAQGNLLDGTDERDPLRDRITELGGKPNKTWGAAKLKEEIKRLEGEKAGGDGSADTGNAGSGSDTGDQE